MTVEQTTKFLIPFYHDYQYCNHSMGFYSKKLSRNVTPSLSPVFPLWWVKWMGREASQSPTFNMEVKNEWICTYAPPACLHGVHKDSCTFFCLACSASF